MAQKITRQGEQKKKVLLLESDPSIAQKIHSILSERGFMPVRVDSVASMLTMVEADEAIALLVSADSLQDCPEALLDSLLQVARRQAPALPVFYLSAKTDFDTRIWALRKGFSHFLGQPLDFSRLLRLLENYGSIKAHDPYRVLLIDDDPVLLRLHTLILEEAGMVTQAISDPAQALEAAHAFNPELIILDLYMFGCLGTELAAILRDCDRFNDVPIIFLSSEDQPAKQLEALTTGGDAFLSKPVDPEQLVDLINQRIQHARQLRLISRQLDSAMREVDARQHALDQHAIVSITDHLGNIIYANDKFCEISGYRQDELIGQNHRLIKSGLHDQAFYDEMWATIAQGHIWHGVVANRRKDGNIYWVASTIVPFMGEDGLPSRYISIRTDITERMEIEKALRESEDRLRLSQIFANIGTWDWNIQTGELYWSERIAPLFGYDDLVETTYQNFLDAVHPDDRQAVVDAVNACLEHDTPYDIEHRVVWPGGQVRWLIERGAVKRDRDGKPLHMLGVVQDITARKQAELALQESEQRLREAQRIAQIGHWSLEIATGRLSWSDEIYRIFGREPGEFEPSYARFFEALHPDDLPLVKASEAKALQHEGGHSIDHRIVLPNGCVRWVHEEAHASFGPDGEPVQLSGTVQDITARKEVEAELQLAKQEAERANLAKSEFLSSMSHELRTPLNAILGFTQLLEIDDNLTAEQRDNIREIVNAGKHLLSLIGEVLDLAKIEAGRMTLSIEAIHLDELLQSCLSIIQPMAWKRGIAIQADFDRNGFKTVLADHTRLKQVLMNLLSNAIKYNRDGGQIEVSWGPAGNSRFRVSVRDTGSGIAPERLKEMFQPFSRLGAENTTVEGTGIGLVISKRLMEAMHGRIGVDSQEGVGSTFWIEIPVAASDLSVVNNSTEQLQQHMVPQSGEHTVLYVEDNPANLKLMINLLAKWPTVRLLTAHTGALGIEMARIYRPDLILLDINLPELDGYGVLRELRNAPETRDVPVVALTANAMPKDIERGKAAGFLEYLTKPLDVANFYTLLGRLLSSS
jgi:PAS domain S-box-containing protein